MKKNLIFLSAVLLGCFLTIAHPSLATAGTGDPVTVTTPPVQLAAGEVNASSHDAYSELEALIQQMSIDFSFGNFMGILTGCQTAVTLCPPLVGEWASTECNVFMGGCAEGSCGNFCSGLPAGDCGNYDSGCTTTGGEPVGDCGGGGCSVISPSSIIADLPGFLGITIVMIPAFVLWTWRRRLIKKQAGRSE